MSKKDQANAEKIFTDFVSKDKDWRGVIDNELRCQEGWHRDWGFLADNSVSEKPSTKEEQIQLLEEKLKSMKDVKINSISKQTYRGGEIDFSSKSYNKLKINDLQPQSRRPKYISKAHEHLKSKLGDDYEIQPYQNYLGSK